MYEAHDFLRPLVLKAGVTNARDDSKGCPSKDPATLDREYVRHEAPAGKYTHAHRRHAHFSNSTSVAQKLFRFSPSSAAVSPSTVIMLTAAFVLTP